MLVDDARAVAESVGRADETYDEMVEEWRKLIDIRSAAGWRDESSGHLIIKTNTWVPNPDHPDLIEEQEAVTEKYRQVVAEIPAALTALRTFIQDHGLCQSEFLAFEAYAELSRLLWEGDAALESVARDAQICADEMTQRVVTTGPNDPYLTQGTSLTEAAVSVERLKRALERLIWPPSFGTSEAYLIDETNKRTLDSLDKGSGSVFWLGESEGTPVLFLGTGNFPQSYTDSLEPGTVTMLARGSLGSAGSVEVSGTTSQEDFKEAFRRLSKKSIDFV